MPWSNGTYNILMHIVGNDHCPNLPLAYIPKSTINTTVAYEQNNNVRMMANRILAMNISMHR